MEVAADSRGTNALAGFGDNDGSPSTERRNNKTGEPREKIENNNRDQHTQRRTQGYGERAWSLTRLSSKIRKIDVMHS